jgi:hypothetical protein
LCRSSGSFAHPQVTSHLVVRARHYCNPGRHLPDRSRRTLRSCCGISSISRQNVLFFSDYCVANLNLKSRWIGEVTRSQLSPMQYKQYTVQTFERELGKWRASVRRTDGRLLWKGRARIRSFVTAMDATTPQRALQMALAAIDRGAFSRRPVDRRMPRGHRHRNAS